MIKKITNYLNPNSKFDFDARSKSVDSKTLADRKADAAGEKWRKKVEASGEKPMETGGPKGLEPTRYGDWERAGRCVDF